MAKREKQQITWNTAPMMKRYRELKAAGKSGLEASRIVLAEARAGELSVTKPPSVTKHPDGSVTVYEPHHSGVPVKTTYRKAGRPRQHESAADRQRAYRERQSNPASR